MSCKNSRAGDRATVDVSTQPTARTLMVGGVGRGLTPPAVVLSAVFTLVFCCATLAFAVLRPVQVLPLLHPAPPIALRAADGTSVTLERMGGTIVVFQVSALRCALACADGHETLRRIQQRLAAAAPPVPVRLVTVMLDGDGRMRALAARAAALGAAPGWWQVATADPDQLKDIVGAGFGVYYTRARDGRVAFDPATILVDDRGVVRADYRTAAISADLLWRDIGLVAREAVSHGVDRALYGAAHLFLCYPRSGPTIGG